jgi:hypothetical protein
MGDGRCKGKIRYPMDLQSIGWKSEKGGSAGGGGEGGVGVSKWQAAGRVGGEILDFGWIG